jgi:hypothetical protein
MPTSKKTARLQLTKFPRLARSKPCERAAFIAETAHAACDALLGAYELVRHQRGRPRGMTTDNEQDLLRSMLVMAGAGIDATVKQLVQDSVSHLIARDSKAQNSFEKFVARRLLASESNAAVNVKLLASVLTSATPQVRLIEEYIAHLTGGSLQSADSLFEVAAALGAEPNAIGLIPGELKPIFDTRNKIIHELDVNLQARKRARNVRGQALMISHTERIFALAHELICSVDARLTVA